MRLSRIILLALAVIFIGQILYFYPQLPDIMASHFGARGEPDGWSGKLSFFILMGIVGLLSFGIGPLCLAMIKNLPLSVINLPNKEYWLSGERREEALEMLREQFEWFSVALAGFMAAVTYLVIQANLLKQPLSGNTWALLAVFLVFVTIWCIRFFRLFRLPD